MPHKEFHLDTEHPGFLSPVTSGPGGKGETWPPVGETPDPEPHDALGVVPNINKGYNKHSAVVKR